MTLDGGFEPGKTYEIAYRAANPPVAGLGFVAMRDIAAWLKHQPDAVAPVRYAYAFGSSQSGRFLRSFLYEGFNTDERDRQVFDGVMAHIAGAARIDLNERWSTPTGLGAYNATAFPFADASAARSGERRARRAARRTRGAARHAPKVFYTNTPVEYWGAGRVAALVHTDAGRHRRPAAAGERARLFHRRHAAFAEPLPAGGHQRPAAGQRGRLLVDDARAAAGDAQVGEGRRRRRRRASIRGCRIARWCQPRRSRSRRFPASRRRAR